MPEAVYIPDPREITALASDLPGGDLGGGIGGWQEVYIDRDPLPPDEPDRPAVNYPSGGGPMTQWNVASQSWT